jgi:5-methylcytosine-specific restriction endonuclease McrA
MSQAWAGGSTTAWRKLRAAVLLRDGGMCQTQTPGLCLVYADVAAHIIPKSAGGPDELGNLKASCAPCNQHEGDDVGNPAPRPVTRW